MKRCVIFGGAGYVGTHLTRHLLNSGRFTHVHIADINPSPLEGSPGVTTSITDVRHPLQIAHAPFSPDWIFNLAAVHREPGHEPHEYYQTNLAGAVNVCDYAEVVGCENIFFTSSISVYGPTAGATDETAAIRPTTPYGGSKYPAEVIHQRWQKAGTGRRLIVSRPGVLYGPDDPGNILRMIKAIKNGYFAFPGSPSVVKSYGYIFGFMDSINHWMDSAEDHVVYNYAESPTQPLGDLVAVIKDHLECRALVLPLPLWLLLPASKLIQSIAGTKNPIHPVRVKKAATPTHIVPQRLIDTGFRFRYDFLESLRHWERIAPYDFDSQAVREVQLVRPHLVPPVVIPKPSQVRSKMEAVG